MRITEEMIAGRIMDFVDGEIQKDPTFQEDKQAFDSLLEKLRGTLELSTILELEELCSSLWVKATDLSYRHGLNDGLVIQRELKTVEYR